MQCHHTSLCGVRLMADDMTTSKPVPGGYLWLAVSAVSFGGIGLEFVLLVSGLPIGVQAGIWGCVAASFLLFYLAYTKPRRDIVSLFAPVYAVLIFVLPSEFSTGPVMQILFAASISILALRVEKRFSMPRSQKRTMKQVLNDYIERITPLIRGIDEETGHLIASSLLTYKFGLYGNAVERCTEALDRLRAKTAMPDAIEAALLILRERAEDLAASRVTPTPHYTFAGTDRAFLAINIPEEEVEDQAALDLDNALIMLYAVGIETSPQDEQALEEHQRFAIQILESYRDKMGASTG